MAKSGGSAGRSLKPSTTMKLTKLEKNALRQMLVSRAGNRSDFAWHRALGSFDQLAHSLPAGSRGAYGMRVGYRVARRELNRVQTRRTGYPAPRNYGPRMWSTGKS